MSEQPPNVPWVDQQPQGPWQQQWQQQPPGSPNAWQLPPIQRLASPPNTPLAAIEKRVNLALGLSIFSIFCGGIIFSVIALILVFRAEAQARSFGVTSSDAKIKHTKWIAIGATLLWVVVLIALVIGAANGNQSTPNNNTGF